MNYQMRGDVMIINIIVWLVIGGVAGWLASLLSTPSSAQ
jgi:uncharacterized membrane protein YeaQ/YmgE (transglycosylase-associated protein family)